MPDDDRMLTPTEAADILGLPPALLRHRVAVGDLTAVDVGGEERLREADVLALKALLDEHLLENDTARHTMGTDRRDIAARLAVFREGVGGRTAGTVADLLADARRDRTRQLLGALWVARSAPALFGAPYRGIRVDLRGYRLRRRDLRGSRPSLAGYRLPIIP